MGTSESYSVTVLLDANDTQDIDDRAEARTYIVSDRKSGTAIIIDAVLENVERDCKVIRDLGLTLLFAVETHIHADPHHGGISHRRSYGCTDRLRWRCKRCGRWCRSISLRGRSVACRRHMHPRRDILIAAPASWYLAPSSQVIRCSSVVTAGRTCKVARQRCYSIPYTTSFLVFQTTPSCIPVMNTTVGCHRRSRRQSNGTKGSPVDIQSNVC